MITNHSIVLVFLWVSMTEAPDAPVALWYNEESYYTTVVSTTDEITEQDRIDAKYIIDQQLSEEAFASVLLYREKIRCFAIMREINTRRMGYDYVGDNYLPMGIGDSSPFKDLVYALTKDENIVLGGYLEYYFHQKDINRQIIAMTLTKDMMQMIATYDKFHAPSTFKELRKDQDGIYEHMLRVWVRGNREPDSHQTPDPKQLLPDVYALIVECDQGGWEEDRDVIEKVLMQMSVPHAQAVIDGFEKSKGEPLETIILEKMTSDNIRDIGDAYASLTRYIKNRPKYISDIMFQYCEGLDIRAVWFICIAVNSANDWKVVNEVFQQDHSQTLSQFIMDKMTTYKYDKTMTEMVAVIVDPTFKPTTFRMKPLTPDGGPGDNVTAPAGTPPPVSPTNIAPGPAPPTSPPV